MKEKTFVVDEFDWRSRSKTEKRSAGGEKDVVREVEREELRTKLSKKLNHSK